MKKISIIVPILLALVLIGETGYLFQQSGKLQNLFAQQGNLQQQIIDLNKGKASLDNERSQLKTEVGELGQANKSLSDDISRLKGEAKTTSDRVISLEKSLQEKTNSADKLLSENLALKQKYTCKSQFSSTDFSSNEKVSLALVDYINQHKTSSEPITAHYWNLIWTDSKFSTHTIEANSPKDNIVYTWTFTVYFKGEADGDHVNGVFFNDRQCWLYLEK